MLFNGKVVIVTGASAGIGAATAVKFAEQGAKVVLAARNEAKLEEVAEKCQRHGPIPLKVVADVSKDEDIRKIINSTLAEYGKIDVLINNAGIGGNVAIDDPTAMEVYDRIMTTNLRSCVYLTHLAAPHLVKTRGNIVNVSSVAAVDSISANHFSYCTSKAGMDHFTRSVALDLGPKGVRVNTVNPGPVRTSFIDAFGLNKQEQEKFWKKWEEYTALGRVSESEEVGDLVLFLASEKAKAITGSSYVIDNGMLLNRNVKLID